MEQLPGAVTRIDPPHPALPSATLPETAREPSALQLAAVASQVPDYALAQLQAQAEQLAEYLQARQRKLDQREALATARHQQLEQEETKFRQWAQERETALRDHEQRVQQQAAGAHDAVAVTSAGAAEPPPNRGPEVEMPERPSGQERLSATPPSLVAERQNLAARLRRLHRRLQQQRATCEWREGRLRRTEAALGEYLHQLELDRQQFAAEMADVRQSLADQRRQLAARQQEAEQETQEIRLRLQQRAENLEQRESALEQLHREVTRLHCETLEMRLLSEEAWARLTRTAEPLALSTSLQQLRKELDARYGAAQVTVDQKESHLRQLAARLQEQHGALATQREELQHWLRCRQDELARQMALIAQREQNLEQQQTRAWERQRQWLRERLELQQQSRGLDTQRRHPRSVAA